MSIDARVEAERLLQEARRRWFAERCGREPWFTAWQYVYEEDERMGWLSCYLVPVGDSATQLSSPDYGRIPDTYAPGFDESEEGYRYERYGNSGGYEPLVHLRSWDGLHPKETEVVEEYRLFHNLFRTSDGNLARVSTDGATDETVVRFTEAGAVEFLLGPLRQYLAAKQCALVSCIDWREFTHTGLTAIGVDDEPATFQSGASIYRIAFGDRTLGNAFSRLLGKKVIEPPSVERAGVWPLRGRAG